MLILAALLLFVLHAASNGVLLALLSAAVTFELVEKVVLVWMTRRIPVSVGPEAMIGRPVQVTSACRPVGRVRMGAESWRARCADGADSGDRLVVQAVDHVTLIVGRPQRTLSTSR